MQRIDSDGSGCIDFTEFLAACMDWGKVLTEDKLRQAFKFVDKDNSGNITT